MITYLDCGGYHCRLGRAVTREEYGSARSTLVKGRSLDNLVREGPPGCSKNEPPHYCDRRGAGVGEPTWCSEEHSEHHWEGCTKCLSGRTSLNEHCWSSGHVVQVWLKKTLVFLPGPVAPGYVVSSRDKSLGRGAVSPLWSFPRRRGEFKLAPNVCCVRTRGDKRRSSVISEVVTSLEDSDKIASVGFDVIFDGVDVDLDVIASVELLVVVDLDVIASVDVFVEAVDLDLDLDVM